MAEIVTADPVFRRTLTRLLAARLLLAGSGVALALALAGDERSPAEEWELIFGEVSTVAPDAR